MTWTWLQETVAVSTMCSAHGRHETYQLGLDGTHGIAIGLNVSQRVVIIGSRRALELHVADVVACLDDDPAVQVSLEAGMVNTR